MTKITVNKSEFISFLSVFTKGVPDLRLDCAGSRVTVEVAYASFYLRKYFFSVQVIEEGAIHIACLLYTSPSPRDRSLSRMPSSA